MDSDNENPAASFANKGGDQLNLDEEGFNDSDDVDDDEQVHGVGSGDKKTGKGDKEVKGEKLENQPYDLAVDVNDSEEIESEEDDDEVPNMNQP
jgi:hypothetical protein